MKTYSRREWLNPDNVPADSSITAFHGDNYYCDTEVNVIENPETILRIKDCYKAVKFSPINGNMKEFVAKVRLIAEVCNEFADFIEKEQEGKE